MASIGILVYIFGLIFVVFWGYLTTKITFLMISKENVLARMILWFVIAWPLALALYLLFVIYLGLLGAIYDSLFP